MSRSLTHLDMEDVLSSIRKLVTDIPDAGRGERARPELFVLTPAHRVSEIEELAADDASEPVASVEQEPVPEEPAAGGFDLREEPAEWQAEPRTEPAPVFEHAADAGPGDAEPTFIDEALEGAAMPANDAEALAEPDLVAPAAAEADAPQGAEADAGPATIEQEEVARTAPPQSLEARIAELEAAVGDADGQWEPDGSEDQQPHMPELHFLRDFKERFIDRTLEEALGTALFREPGDEPDAPHQDVAADDAAPEDVVVFSHRSRKATPTEEAPQAAPPRPEAQEATRPGQPSRRSEAELWAGEDDMLVDEDVLRRVVADIVREELQGRLGERITRNVRRMVRQEIERAISIKSLE